MSVPLNRLNVGPGVHGDVRQIRKDTDIRYERDSVGLEVLLRSSSVGYVRRQL